MAREQFHTAAKLCLRWSGPRRVVHAVNYYVYIVEELRNGALAEAHTTRLKYHADASLNAKAILPHAISSETGMQIQRLLRLVDDADGLYVSIRWSGLPSSEATSSRYTNIMEMLNNSS